MRDISLSGLGLHDLAANVGRKSASHTVVDTHGDSLLTFRRRSRWQAAGPLSKKIDVQNAEAPARWTDFGCTFESVGRQGG